MAIAGDWAASTVTRVDRGPFVRPSRRNAAPKYAAGASPSTTRRFAVEPPTRIDTNAGAAIETAVASSSVAHFRSV